MGGWVAFVVALGTLVEIAPIKVNPIGWLGKHLNADMYKRVDKIESKLDSHIAESYRNYIFAIQDKLLEGKLLTHEEWKKAIKSCVAYESYIKSNELENGLADEAIKYIRNNYSKALNNNTFKIIGDGN